jgi:hypothetical protein
VVAGIPQALPQFENEVRLGRRLDAGGHDYVGEAAGLGAPSGSGKQAQRAGQRSWCLVDRVLQVRHRSCGDLVATAARRWC